MTILELFQAMSDAFTWLSAGTNSLIRLGKKKSDGPGDAHDPQVASPHVAVILKKARGLVQLVQDRVRHILKIVCFRGWKEPTARSFKQPDA
ncbi:hypothetical protein [Mesorhizobium sp. LSJC264A00]|uniref:hypothetical protein n=1 Tax=unclassified Mesorhizobium TaxID=325217 RepID=UPI0012EC777D|nr:hypothetical protein [Mesorhizobium sp. LSJC264A00]